MLSVSYKFNNFGVNPHSSMIFISFSIEMPDVVSISPEIAALAPERKQDFPWSGIRPLPPASRMADLGSRSRKIATVRRISKGSSGVWSSRGVSGMGFNTLIGTE